jgi:hypothetical protein
MLRLQNMIDELTTRADDSDLIALLATSRKARLENVALARELRDVVGALKRELHYRQSLADLTIGRNSGGDRRKSERLSISEPPMIRTGGQSWQHRS